MRALKQDEKEKRYGRICLLLGIILLGTVGCSHTVSDTPSIDAEIAEFLQVSESQAESLWEGIQTIDQNSRAEKTTVHVRQAFGNEREMYVLYDVTFSTEIDLQKEENNGILPTTVTLSGVGEVSKAGKGGSVYTIGINGQTITYLSYFESNLDQYPEGDLLLTLGQFKAGGKTEATSIADEVHEFSWTPTTHGTILRGDIVTKEGKTIGSVSVSPFSRRLAAESSSPTEYVDFLRSIMIIDRNGTAVRPKGGSGGGAAEDPLGKEPLTNIAGSIDFRVLLELSDVAAVQIDGYTVPLSKS